MTTKPSASNSGSTKKETVAEQLANAIKIAQANNSGNAATGAVVTQQDAEADVQALFGQLFGRSGVGVDYKKALGIYLNQSQDTGAPGRQQAVVDYLQTTPEFEARQENRYLDAIYNAIQADVQKARR
jgi:hypothetical protein